MISYIVCGMKISNESSEHVNIAVDLIIVFVEFITCVTLVCSALYRNDSRILNKRSFLIFNNDIQGLNAKFRNFRFKQKVKKQEKTGLGYR